MEANLRGSHPDHKDVELNHATTPKSGHRIPIISRDIRVLYHIDILRSHILYTNAVSNVEAGLNTLTCFLFLLYELPKVV